MIILGIETSCDDTCVSIMIMASGRKRPRFDVLSDVRSSQVKIHAPYGGVVPNLAARAHLENMNHVLRLCFKNANMKIADGKSQIDLITVTTHPGLIPCLLIGTNVARTLAWTWDKPIIGVNHLEGHIYANWLMPICVKSKVKSQKLKVNRIKFPAIALIVSGGHTQLVLMRNYGKFKIIGETLDDAAGEAFDKIARLLGLPFPGGLAISQQAAKWKSEISAFAFAKATADKRNPKSEIKLPRPMINSKNYDFSFSGLKTAVLYLVKDRFIKHGRLTISNEQLAELCAEFQQTVIDVLVSKTIRAAKRYGAKTVILGGGVGANKELRRQLKTAVKENLPNVDCQLSPVKYCTDNAAMIAMAGYFRYLERKAKTWKDIKAKTTV